MDPITAVALATGIVKQLGLDAVVGKWLGGDKGAEIATKIVDVASTVTGAGKDGAIAALQQDSAAATQLRIEVLKMAGEEADREYADRSNARAMQVAALQQDDVQSKRFLYRFAWFWSSFACLYIMLVTFVPMPDKNARYADMVLGFLLGTIVATMITFFFGSSSSSKTNTNTMQALLAKLTPPAQK